MKSLFKPITINKLEVPNRIAMAPMTRMMSPDGIPGENVKDYYQRRAAGEVGLIITEGVEVSHPSSSGYPNVCLLYTSPSPRDDISSRMPSSA